MEGMTPRGMTIDGTTTWGTRSETSFGALLNHLALGLTLAVFMTGTVADRLVRAEQFTVQESAASVLLLAWGLGVWAAIAWLGAAWQLSTTWRQLSRTTLVAALLKLALTAGLFAIAFEAWKPFGSGWG